jgi:hypothetical protein
MTLKSSSYLLPKFSRVPSIIVLISGISSMVNGTLLNFGKRYEDNLMVIFDQWPKLHLGLDALSNQKFLNGIYYACTHLLSPHGGNFKKSFASRRTFTPFPSVL